jgi:hypothetical protein
MIVATSRDPDASHICGGAARTGQPDKRRHPTSSCYRTPSTADVALSQLWTAPNWVAGGRPGRRTVGLRGSVRVGSGFVLGGVGRWYDAGRDCWAMTGTFATARIALFLNLSREGSS